jgi:hypothetical protein
MTWREWEYAVASSHHTPADTRGSQAIKHLLPLLVVICTLLFPSPMKMKQIDINHNTQEGPFLAGNSALTDCLLVHPQPALRAGGYTLLIMSDTVLLLQLQLSFLLA